MGNILDSIIKVRQDVYTTISADYKSEVFNIDHTEGGFALAISTNNGNGAVNMNFSLELSADGVNFAEVPETIINRTEDTGNITYDILGTNTTTMRVSIAVTAGALDLETITLTAKRRH